MPQPARSFRAEPYSYTEARALADQLGVSDPVAITLVRRGYRTPAAARAYLEASEAHDPNDFESMPDVSARLLAACSDGKRITVHGDYDTDGVCSTAILVAALRRLGAECDWFIPDRLADGYGLSTATIETLAARGTEVLLTADCGITSVAEIAAARLLGFEVIVTDHHSPGDRLPNCPILHPVVSGYPCPDLCATGVAYKLSCALDRAAAEDPSRADADLDLVALATVADLVPLRGENRTLVRRGLAEARRALRPGLRALMAVSHTDPAQLDEGDLAFRLAPRINAAGRLYRADAGVELMLTQDEARASQIAAELDGANHERRAAEREVLIAAEKAFGELPPEQREAEAIVLAGHGWHPGVVGIVASRLVERHWRPVILIGLDEHGGRGSGRSIPGFDLLAGLTACAGHLRRFGGHRAAAGLEIEASEIEAFREAFLAHAGGVLSASDLTRSDSVDAVVGGDSLGLDLAEELQGLAPFGMGNPGPRLLVPSARLFDVRPMGEGKHARFSLQSGGARAAGVAFGAGTNLAAEDEPLDVGVRLEVNRWNGAVEPRVVLRELYPHPESGDEDPAGCVGCPSRATGLEWWERFDAELEADVAAWPPRDLLAAAGTGAEREVIAHAPGGAVAAIAELLSSGDGVLALCADAGRRRGLAERAADPGRFGGGGAQVVCVRCADAPSPQTDDCPPTPGLTLADWGALCREPALARRFEHVVLVDPPPFGHLESLAARGGESPWSAGYLHPAWGPAELDLARRVHAAEWDMGETLPRVFRALRSVEAAAGDSLVALLEGSGRHPRSAEQSARSVRVLVELGLLAWAQDGGERGLRVVSSERTDLERSAAYRAYRSRHEEGERFLSSQEAVR